MNELSRIEDTMDEIRTALGGDDPGNDSANALSRVETILNDIRDLVIQGGGGGAAGEPDDSMTEVYTGKKDALGREIYKITYVGTLNPGDNLIVPDFTKKYNLYDTKGFATDPDGTNMLKIDGGLPEAYWKIPVFCMNNNLYLRCLGGSSFTNGPYYFTVYYTKKEEV